MKIKPLSRLIVSVVLCFAFLLNTLPCGPGYITPLFDTTSAPEYPYEDFAAGRLGIIKPKFRRSVLYAAYRYVAGGGLSTAEQKAMVEVWKAEIDNKDFRDDSIDVAVRAWVEKRKEVVGKEEKTPEIYVERSYGGYDFFPNCTKNAFETATETLTDRIAAHGATDRNVENWLAGQDQVFQNCSNGKQRPDIAPVGSPAWLEKDRAYQTAAASFYSLDYNDAKRRFAEIAQDSESVWRETADYLVARTLIRQASLSKSAALAAPFYEEAEAHLQRFVSSSGKFSASAERLMGLIKYRLHPKERTSELARNLTMYGGGENFRQDVIDYNWLLDKFESEVLTEEERRKDAESLKETNINAIANAANAAANAAATAANTMANAANAAATDGRPSDAVTYTSNVANSAKPVAGNQKKNDDDLEINIYSPDYSENWRIYVKIDATDAEAIAEAEKVIDRPLTDEIRTQIRNGRQSAYSDRFTANVKSAYEGGYWGDIDLTPSLLPDFLRQDELTDWLFAFQMSGADAYLYSLQKFRERNSDLWLMTALAQADKSSTQLPRLLDAAGKVSRSSAAYTTIAYHAARILLDQGKQSEGRKLIDEMLSQGDQLPISARNSFMELKLKVAATLDDFLKSSLKKAYAFDFDGETGTVESIIAEQKKYFDPEYNKEGREAYDAEIDARYREERLWQDREMFDAGTIELLNQYFPTATLIDVMKSQALPDHMRELFATVIWTRAFLLNDTVLLEKATAELAKYRPELTAQLGKVNSAKTSAARENAILYFVLKNPILSPYFEEGMGKTNNEQEQWSADDWWCEPYDSEYSEETNGEVPRRLPPRPAFLTAAQSQTAQSERKKLKGIGDAPKFLAEKVRTWAKRYPTDRRVPESLYIMIEANGWTKYGCGNNEELSEELRKILQKNYPHSEWTAKLAADEAEK